jgi:LPS sulfotransferase NodH
MSDSENEAPFFILGCPRSGTTILRDLLRTHDRLAAPEETHFYRWSYAFQSPRYTQISRLNPVLLRHRDIDGVSEEKFARDYDETMSRKELQDRYMRAYLEKIGKPNARWFDKTPQNVYGILLLKGDYPQARFVHIHRNPVNVVASLLRGEVMQRQSLQAAINWWLEAITIMNAFRQAFPDIVLDIGYDELTSQPDAVLPRILEFVGEAPDALHADLSMLRAESRGIGDLTTADAQIVLQRCSSLMRSLGYPVDIESYR